MDARPSCGNGGQLPNASVRRNAGERIPTTHSRCRCRFARPSLPRRRATSRARTLRRVAGTRDRQSSPTPGNAERKTHHRAHQNGTRSQKRSAGPSGSAKLELRQNGALVDPDRAVPFSLAASRESSLALRQLDVMPGRRAEPSRTDAGTRQERGDPEVALAARCMSRTERARHIVVIQPRIECTGLCDPVVRWSAEENSANDRKISLLLTVGSRHQSSEVILSSKLTLQQHEWLTICNMGTSTGLLPSGRSSGGGPASPTRFAGRRGRRLLTEC